METRVTYVGNGVWLAEAMTSYGSWRSQGTYYSAVAARAACERAVTRGWA